MTYQKRYWEGVKHRRDTQAAFVRGKKAALRSDPFSGWISMEERKPEVGTYCLFHIPLKAYPNYMVVGFIQSEDPNDSVLDLCGDPIGYDISDIAYWMLLPETLTF